MDEQNKYTIIVSERAKQMLVSHAAFLAQTSVKAAQRLADSFEKTTNTLEFMLQRCAWLTNEFIPRNMYRYLLFEKRYMLIFQVKDNTVYVDYVIDCRQDYEWLIL